MNHSIKEIKTCSKKNGSECHVSYHGMTHIKICYLKTHGYFPFINFYLQCQISRYLSTFLPNQYLGKPKVLFNLFYKQKSTIERAWHFEVKERHRLTIL